MLGNNLLDKYRGIKEGNLKTINDEKDTLYLVVIEMLEKLGIIIFNFDSCSELNYEVYSHALRVYNEMKEIYFRLFKDIILVREVNSINFQKFLEYVK